MLVELFKNVQIAVEENNIYNRTHKSYLNLYFNDDELKEEVRAIITLLNKNNINDVKCKGGIDYVISEYFQ